MTNEQKHQLNIMLEKIEELSSLNYEGNSNGADYYVCPFCTASAPCDNTHHNPGFWGVQHDDDCLAIISREMQQLLGEETEE